MKNLFYVLSVTCFCLAAVMFYKGYDRMTNYRNSEYRSVNAYVGGDAYNYIINGTHATVYCVVGGAGAITGALFLIGGTLVSIFEDKSKQVVMAPNGGNRGKEDEDDDALPPL